MSQTVSGWDDLTMASSNDDFFTSIRREPAALIDFTGGSKRNLVTVYSRRGCHLCDVALEILTSLQGELDFDVEKLFIDGDDELEKKYGEQIPVIQIDGEHHDFWRVDPDRFRSSLERHRQHR